jgi:hypothetical protein
MLFYQSELKIKQMKQKQNVCAKLGASLQQRSTQDLKEHRKDTVS